MSEIDPLAAAFEAGKADAKEHDKARAEWLAAYLVYLERKAVRLIRAGEPAERIALEMQARGVSKEMAEHAVQRALNYNAGLHLL